MRFAPSPKKAKKPVKLPPVQDIGGVATFITSLNQLKDEMVDATVANLEKIDAYYEKVDDKVESYYKKVDDKVEELEGKVNEVKELHRGNDGKDADEQAIARYVLSQIRQPADGHSPDVEEITQKVLSRIPVVNEKSVIKEILGKIPKASLKVIQEKIEIDPIIDRILKDERFKTAQETGIAETKRDLRSQIRQDLGYVHGGGDTVGAGSGITITVVNGVKVISATGGGSGDVNGPASSTDNAIARFDGTGGKTLQNSGVTISDTNVLTTAGTIDSSLTASEILGTNGSKQLVSLAVATYPSLTELTYVKGVTSAIQTQINTKQATISFGTGVQTALGVNIGSAGAPVLFNGALGTPSSGTLTNATGYTVANLSGAGTGVLTALGVNIGSAGAFVTFNGALGTPSSGTGTNITGIPAASILAGTFGSGAYTMNTSLTVPQIFTTNNAVTAVANATTFTRANRINTVTNNSAATLTITLSTASALDGDLIQVRILDFSAVAQTLTLVNTENSTVTPPASTNGSTTLPLTLGFQYNSNTSKWRLIASC